MSYTSQNQPHVFLDVANLIGGEGTPFEESRATLQEHLPLIERCCLRLWEALPVKRFASSLETIDERLHELLREAGYEVEVISAQRSETMLIEACSKRDDYVLKRAVKRRLEGGAREALIVSGDRDFETLALEVSVFGADLHFVQRQKQKTTRNDYMQRHRCLKDFSQPLNETLEALLRAQLRQGVGTLSAPTLGPRLCLSHRGDRLEELELFSGFTIGRNSGSSGRVDLCLSPYDRNKDYSRQLAQVLKLGDAWVLWRQPQEESKVTRQPISVHSGGPNANAQLLGSGEGLLLQPGDLITFDRCELQMIFKA